MKKIILFALIMVMIIEPWILSLVYCEVLTAKHYDVGMLRAINAYEIGESKEVKILEYEPYSYCKVYGKSDESGSIFILRYAFDAEQPGWEVVIWNTIWSKAGSADGFVWPYIR